MSHVVNRTEETNRKWNASNRSSSSRSSNAGRSSNRNWCESRRKLVAGLLAVERSELFRMLGFESIYEYAERHFGYGKEDVDEFLEVADALERLPKCAEAFMSGTLSWRLLRALGRVATRRNEARWLECADRMSPTDLIAYIHRESVRARALAGKATSRGRAAAG